MEHPPHQLHRGHMHQLCMQTVTTNQVFAAFPLHAQTLIILVVVLPTAFVLALLLLLFRELRLRTGRTLFGRVKAPAAGDDTTLVVSDIEGSTQLWEQVGTAGGGPGARAAAKHGGVIRTSHASYSTQPSPLTC